MTTAIGRPPGTIPTPPGSARSAPGPAAGSPTWPSTGVTSATDVPSAIDVRGLTKRYGRRTAVDGLDITIPTGVVAGFVGPNGAGKTTTLRMLLGLVRPSGGDGTVLGQPLRAPAAYLPRVGALIESPALYPALSGRRNLTALAVLAGIPRAQVDARVETILDQVGLAGRGGDRFRSYSLGMKQRLAIGAALLTDPDLLVLDEPTNGLDPIGIREMRTLIRSLTGRPTQPPETETETDADADADAEAEAARPRGRTVLVSSHLLAEVEQICDWLIVVEGGRLAYQGPTDRLMASHTVDVVLRPEHDRDIAPLTDLLAGLGLPATRGERDVVVTVDAGDRESREYVRALAEVNRAAASRGITLIEMSPRRDSLEDRYQGLVTAARADGATHPPSAHTSTAHTSTVQGARR